MQVNEINKNQALQSASKSKASGQTTGASFSSYLEANMKVDNAPISSSALGVSATDALLAAQMVDGDEEKQKREKMLERGKGLLERLEEIRDGLLLGYISEDRLYEISRYVKERKPQIEDEKINELMAEIELRVEVELAKLLK